MTVRIAEISANHEELEKFVSHFLKRVVRVEQEDGDNSGPIYRAVQTTLAYELANV
jgi:hypothetical protein